MRTFASGANIAPLVLISTRVVYAATAFLLLTAINAHATSTDPHKQAPGDGPGTALVTQTQSSFDLPYIGVPDGPDSGNLSLTFAGNGFVTAFPSGFIDAFSMDNAHSYMQVDIGNLRGKKIISARLDFFIGGGATDDVLFTSFESGGSLGHHFSPPNTISTNLFNVVGGQNNSLDVTELLSDRVADNAQFFALHFTGNTSDLFVQPSGAENLSLTVVTEPLAVPALSTGTIIFLMAVVGLLGLFSVRKRVPSWS